MPRARWHEEEEHEGTGGGGVTSRCAAEPGACSALPPLVHSNLPILRRADCERDHLAKAVSTVATRNELEGDSDSSSADRSTVAKLSSARPNVLCVSWLISLVIRYACD